MRIGRCAFAVAVISLCAAGQSPPARLTFEVVSVKPSIPDSGPFQMSPLPGGKFTGRNIPLRILVEMSQSEPGHKVEDRDLVGAPAWFWNAEYDVTASAGRAISIPELGKMIGSMLEDRFKLATHQETREVAEFALVVGKGGPKFKVAAERKPDDRPGIRPVTSADGPGIIGRDVSIADLAAELGRVLGRSVIDLTKLDDRYDFSLKWTRMSASNPDVPDQGPPTIFTALQEQLGLRLESRKGVGDVLVIDHIERPTDN